jgi:hypothetical protein
LQSGDEERAIHSQDRSGAVVYTAIGRTLSAPSDERVVVPSPAVTALRKQNRASGRPVPAP